ncbi:hypothetical protein PTT_18780 [Pyrenophora teres f. teres 0-1]|uniref:Cyclase domain containing protein n=1 Tax=Pyrenophora teres f. teres (strain 0-1) TaxID=861557 RepID=E3S7H5_PYRTT|nr:hypothetical protein PTT_18780 [Pyrenophora teres f. teres 0-1]
MPPSPPPRPPFSDLPLSPTGPPLNAWTLYGASDTLGSLNTLTPSVTQAAALEIRTGDRISLDWYLNLPSHPSFSRPPFSHKMTQKAHPDGTKRMVNDDHLDFNTQCSSQWDGLRHYGYQGKKVYYGGRTQEELENSDVLGIDDVAHTGGIVTRGVILDYPRWLERRGEKEVYALQAESIGAEVLEEMLKETGVETREGDLLLLRTGFTRDYAGLGEEERRALAGKAPQFLGVRSDEEVLRWIWERGFAAVASDAPSFEMAPLAGPHTAPGNLWAGKSWEQELQGGGLIHQVLLGGWGVMIGEMFDLERLCEKSVELGRSTCFVSSVPLKVPGGVASPPNAVAIF